MNKYKVSFCLAKKENLREHFSNCRGEIEGKNFKEAAEAFKKEMLDRGYVVYFLVEGEMFELKFICKICKKPVGSESSTCEKCKVINNFIEKIGRKDNEITIGRRWQRRYYR
ncbi:hypothetical protein NUG13_12075 [Bacillus subtilis]|uniref:Uncharacterized protein n=1 Tax=Bacillus phage vB_BsuS_PJN02 TaxID=2920374 RepID=A0AC61TS16_9CAUD|nr:MULTISPECIES: hypothetical protein [Bacillus subtilis group]YP_010681760.1 hypothetical protein PQE76_gp142 [Bacillus phage vB_BsuS_PJN02]MCR4362066.1 hypothetical protein [Bacillus subtilis]UNH58485.1 hypothetical protein [Bacillus phage vB_BsuS_PJN02]UQB84320.1 hypothetical protein KMZ31_19555 [Bacillus amyloliquefaciens]WOF32955.1 hypothetical protein OEJ84_22790 [Bacillus subtilis]